MKNSSNKPYQILIEEKSPDGELSTREAFIHDDHPLISRRDFISSGLVQGGAALFGGPLLASALTSNALGATCPVPVVDNTRPNFWQINLAGGYGLTTAFVPAGSDGGPTGNDTALQNHMNRLLPGQYYSRWGRGSDLSSNAIDTSIVNFPLFKASSFYQTLNQLLDPQVKGKIHTIMMVHSSQADTNQTGYALGPAIASFSKLFQLGQQASFTGIGKRFIFNGGSAAVAISNPSVLNNIYGMGGLPSNISSKIYDIAKRFNGGNRRAFLSSLAGGNKVADGIECGAENGKMNSAVSFNPFTSADIDYKSAFNATANSGQTAIGATMALAMGQGLAVAGGLNINSCDMHDSSPNRTLEVNAGVNLAKLVSGIFNIAFKKNKKVFVSLCTDGGATTLNFGENNAWTNDSNDAGHVCMAYDPTSSTFHAPQLQY